MKRILFILAILTLSGNLCYSQLGITGGLNIAKYKYTSDRTNLLAFNAGLVYRAGKAKGNLFVEPQLLYTMKGAVKYPDIDINNDVLKYTNRLSYVELSMPFFFSRKLNDNELYRMDFGIGPYAGYLVHATYTAETYEGDKATGRYKIGSSSSDDFKPVDAGLTFLTGVTISNIGFRFQYDLGLANTNTLKNDAALKMRAAMLNVVIYFGR